MRVAAFLLVFLPTILAAQTNQAEPVYRLRPGVEVPVWGLIGFGAGTSRIAGHGFFPYSPGELDRVLLDFGLDAKRTFAERHFSKTADQLSDLMAVSTAGVAGFQAIYNNPQPGDRWKNTVILAETGLLQLVLNRTVKNWARRTRPFVFNPNVPISEKLKVDARRSFYSGHTGMAASMTFYSAKIWSDYHPDSPRKPLVWATAAVWPMAVGYLRMRAGKHYFTDVLAGYLVGAAIGWGIPALHGRLGF